MDTYELTDHLCERRVNRRNGNVSQGLSDGIDLPLLEARDIAQEIAEVVQFRAEIDVAAGRAKNLTSAIQKNMTRLKDQIRTPDEQMKLQEDGKYFLDAFIKIGELKGVDWEENVLDTLIPFIMKRAPDPAKKTMVMFLSVKVAKRMEEAIKARDMKRLCLLSVIYNVTRMDFDHNPFFSNENDETFENDLIQHLETLLETGEDRQFIELIVVSLKLKLITYKSLKEKENFLEKAREKFQILSRTYFNSSTLPEDFLGKEKNHWKNLFVGEIDFNSAYAQTHMFATLICEVNKF